MRRECRERFPRHRELAIPTCIKTRAWRTWRDACQDSLLVVSIEVGGRENVPGIPGACATHNFTYLVRGPLTGFVRSMLLMFYIWLMFQATHVVLKSYNFDQNDKAGRCRKNQLKVHNTRICSPVNGEQDLRVMWGNIDIVLKSTVRRGQSFELVFRKVRITEEA